MAKILTGEFCWFNRVAAGQSCRTMFEPTAFDLVKNKPVQVWLNHKFYIGTGRIVTDRLKASFEMAVPDLFLRELEMLFYRGKIHGSSMSVSSSDYERRFDAGGEYLAIRSVGELREVGPSADPAERWTTCKIVERADSKPVAASRPVAGKRTKQRMSVPQMPQGMRNGIKLMNAAREGKSVRINGRTIDARTVAALVSNVGPMSIH